MKYKFLFEELVLRDFKEKYKRTILGMGWSILSPLINLAILVLVFTKLLGRNTPHYTIFTFCGTLVMSYFKESTKGGMKSLVANRKIITHINIPKHLLLLSNNVSSLINFCLTLSVFILFCILDKINVDFRFLFLIFAVVCLTAFNIGIGLILSAFYVFFKDTNYLYDLLLTFITYLSGVFYRVDAFSLTVQRLFLCNPLYVYICYFRTIVINESIPSLEYHLLCVLYALLSLGTGMWIYKKYNHQFIYYL